MYFSPFSVNTTNIFPAANTTQGGQLCTEFNLRSIDSVSTDPDVKYMFGPSYVHGPDEFSLVYDETKGNSVITITAGRAVVNGHYVESLADVDIDIADGNRREVNNGNVRLSGTLVVGLVAMYSENTTLIGELDSDDHYLGVQIVVLPESEFCIPGDTEESNTDPDVVTAHIRLGSFSYTNRIKKNTVTNNEAKTKYIDVDRIRNFEDLGSDYFKRTGLAENKLYTVASKFSTSGGTPVKAGFCDTTDSLMKWDRNPITFSQLTTENKKHLSTLLKKNPSASFVVSADGNSASLFIPHKQVDNDSSASIKDTDYAPVVLDLPVADLVQKTPGIVNATYSKIIDRALAKINEFYLIPNGSYLKYIGQLEDRATLPPILEGHNPGDYVIVREDLTLEESMIDPTYSWPTTMYMVLPGIIKEVNFFGTSSTPYPHSGVEIASTYGSEIPSDVPREYNAMWNLEDNQYRGRVGLDYLTYYYQKENDDGSISTTPYYYTVSSSGSFAWSDPMIVTAQIPLASTELIGGFMNVDDDSEHSDAGYVYLDAEGHLRLMDYGLLRQGTLAYQLGTDYEGVGMSIEELQADLDDKVNERVAFPNANSTTDNSNIINVTIEVPAEDAGGTIQIRGLDSRFNTCVYLHILGDANSNTKIQIIDCEKIMIDNAIQGDAVIELYRSNLYYDGGVIDRLSRIEELGLWYEQFDSNDPDIVVDNLTVKEHGASIMTEDIDYWDPENPNDTHYQYALESLSFNTHGEVVGIGLYVRDCSTRDEIPEGKSMFIANFTLPQGSGLTYPPSKFTKKLTVTGSFISSYIPSDESMMQAYTANISFTVLTDVYDKITQSDAIDGTISVCEDSYIIKSIGGDVNIAEDGSANIPGINVNSFHIFYGGVIG